MLKQISETSRLTKLLEETQRNLERPRKRRRVGKEDPDSHDSPSPMGSRRKDGSLYLDDSSEIAMEDIESRSPLECIPSSDVEENEPEIQRWYKSPSLNISAYLIRPPWVITYSGSRCPMPVMFQVGEAQACESTYR